MLGSCKKENSIGCFVSSGKEISIIRELDPFTEIELNHVFEIYLIQDSSSFVEIIAGENLMDGIVSNVIDGRLLIDNNNTCNWMRGYSKILTVRIHCQNFELLTINGECDVFSEGIIQMDTFFIDVNSGACLCDISINAKLIKLKVHAGTGKFTIKGECKSSYVYSHGNAHVFQENLIAERLQIYNNSTGDARINVSNFLHVEFLGRGNIYYKGNPSEIIIQEQYGEGELIKID